MLLIIENLTLFVVYLWQVKVGNAKLRGKHNDPFELGNKSNDIWGIKVMIFDP